MASKFIHKTHRRVYVVTTKDHGQYYEPELVKCFKVGNLKTGEEYGVSADYVTVYPCISSALMGEAVNLMHEGTNRVFVYALDCQKAVNEGVEFRTHQYVVNHRIRHFSHVTKELWIVTPAKFTKIAELDCPHILDQVFYDTLKSETGFDNCHYFIPLRSRAEFADIYSAVEHLSNKTYKLKQLHAKMHLEFYKVKKWAISQHAVRDEINQEDAAFVKSLFPWIANAKINNMPVNVPVSGKYRFLLNTIRHIRPGEMKHARTLDPSHYPIIGGTSFDRTAYLVKFLGDSVETMGLCISYIESGGPDALRDKLAVKSDIVVKTEEGYLFNNRVYKTLDTAIKGAQRKYKGMRVDTYRPDSTTVGITYHKLINMITTYTVKNYQIYYE